MQDQRISIHASNIEEKFRPHPQWLDENENELEKCPFASAESDGARELHELNELIESFLDRAPSDANAELRVSKTADGRFDARIDVYSTARAFGPVRRLGDEFRDVVQNIVEEIRGEIDEWKRNRSLNVGDGL